MLHPAHTRVTNVLGKHVHRSEKKVSGRGYAGAILALFYTPHLGDLVENKEVLGRRPLIGVLF